MRMIGTIATEAQASRLAAHFKRRGISARTEGSFDATGQIHYEIWVEDEDQIQAATQVYEQFVKDPSHASFDTPILEKFREESPEEPVERVIERKKAPFTHLMLFFCCLCFFFNFLQQAGQKEPELTPLQNAFLYELPASWQGLYSWFVGQEPLTLPPFPQLAEGEIWRLFTPIFLHGDLLHILFNMIWLWVLGRPVEQKIGWVRTLLLTALFAATSNTAQYLMSGPLFLGYSGVILGLAGFIWKRERIAPWEGYPVQKGTFWFLGIFVAAVFALQVGAFFIQLSTGKPFSLSIANTAHITGALVGAFIGRFSFFAQQVPK